jgi:hypothetical protein
VAQSLTLSLSGGGASNLFDHIARLSQDVHCELGMSAGREREREHDVGLS